MNTNEYRAIVIKKGQEESGARRPLMVHARNYKEAVDKVVVAWVNNERTEDDIGSIELKWIRPYELS